MTTGHAQILKSEMDRTILVDLVDEYLANNMRSSAIFYAEKLTTLSSANLFDYVKLASCYFQANEHRRCLAILEQSGLLSPPNLSEISAFLLDEISSFEISSLTPKTHAVFLAATCLETLGEREDCLHLLNTIFNCSSFDETDTRGYSALLTDPFWEEGEGAEELSWFNKNYRIIRQARNYQAALTTPSQTNVFAGIFYMDL